MMAVDFFMIASDLFMMAVDLFMIALFSFKNALFCPKNIIFPANPASAGGRQAKNRKNQCQPHYLIPVRQPGFPARNRLFPACQLNAGCLINFGGNRLTFRGLVLTHKTCEFHQNVPV
jgi:hypothetical protein